MDRITRNDNASVTIDLMFAVVLVISAMIGALMIMPNISYEDRDWRIKQYMTATRATDNLVQNIGESKNAGGPEWEDEWKSGNYSNVTNIGLVYSVGNQDTAHKVLDVAKVKALMGPGYNSSEINVKWWEFPNSSTPMAERENATRALGLTGYDFYMQIHPVGQLQFSSTPLETNLSNVNGARLNTVSAVDRYVYIKDPITGEYLKSNDNNNNKVIHYRINMWVW
ncbi:MAG: hypothetical protein HF976_13435 [ANME-2 cluster archaeon]|nr:hypothetical protein [ANME-2 cluster archaeon]MBC2702380.1 hypothetical protein [ANME-2 cluster archaeon]MBC2708617.1 hypothetical protein [ANME-2 cluster archaeon]MBC2745830.1 hypothetical protein [ANME-2 cluster archaeon]MBC2764251.1 hypothetical protein [ANME-2 cluster archaeon]